MDLDQIKKLLELMEKNQVVELEFEEEGKKIRLRRAEERHANNVPVIAPVPIPTALPVTAVPPPAGASPAAPGRAENVFEVKSPLVGTFYRAPKPDAESLVNVGDEVHPEKVMCIIEAMKVMNEIKAEVSGTVREILVKNGQAVEFGEVLFVVEKK